MPILPRRGRAPAPASIVPARAKPLDVRAVLSVDLELVESVAVAPPPTIGDFVERVYRPWAFSRLKPRTVALYAERWDTWIGPSWVDVAWRDVTPLRVLAWVAELANARARTPPHAPLAPRTIRHLHATLPAGRPSARNRARPARWRLEEARRALCAELIPAYRRVEIAFSIFTCARPGEVRGASWRNLRIVDGVPCLVIEQTDDTGDTKTGVVRAVPLHPELVQILTTWRAMWPGLFGRDPTDGDPLFPARYSRGAVSRRSPDQAYFRRLLEQAGLPVITPHGLRRTGAQLYRNAGVAPRDVQCLLGHDDGSATGAYVSDDEIPPALLHRAICRLIVLGPDSSAELFAPRGKLAVSVQAMQPILLQSGTAQPGQMPGHQPATFPLDSRLSTTFPRPLAERGAFLTPAPLKGTVKVVGSLLGARRIHVSAPGFEPTVYTVRSEAEAIRLACSIFLPSAEWRLDVLDASHAILATRTGPDPLPLRGVRRG